MISWGEAKVIKWQQVPSQHCEDITYFMEASLPKTTNTFDQSAKLTCAEGHHQWNGT